jgi:hypothetical protein
MALHIAQEMATQTPTLVFVLVFNVSVVLGGLPV